MDYIINMVYAVCRLSLKGGRIMSTIIETPKMSEILLEEFMEPMGLSAYRLAKEINVPQGQLQMYIEAMKII